MLSCITFSQNNIVLILSDIENTMIFISNFIVLHFKQFFYVNIFFYLKDYELILRIKCCLHAQSLQLYLTLSDPTDCSPPGSSVHGILWARMLKWVAISSSWGSSWPKDWTLHLLCLLHYRNFFPTELPGKLKCHLIIHNFILKNKNLKKFNAIKIKDRGLPMWTPTY